MAERERERGLGEAEPGWAVRCSPLSTPGRDGALTPACALCRDPSLILQPLCCALHPAAGWERKHDPNAQSKPWTHPFSKLTSPCLLNQLGLELKGLIK